MPARAKIGTVMVAGLVALLTLQPARAATNAPASPLQQAIAPLTNQVPLGATNQASASPVAEPAMAEADRFFNAYAEAARFVRLGSDQEAYVVMDVLAKNLRTSPWLEIALLKRSELSESFNENLAIEGDESVLHHLDTIPYYQGTAQRARLFSAALAGAAERGIARVRVTRIRAALAKYYARYRQYPESLAKLAIFNYIDMEDISDANRQPFRYVPTGLQFRPTISYQRYDPLAAPPAEPFSVRSPRLDSTSQVSNNPVRYVALVRVPGRLEPRRVSENETLDGYFVGVISAGGAVVVGNNRVLVLPVPP